MDQRSNATYLSLKGLSAHAIHADLVATLCIDAAVYGSVTRYFREARSAPSSDSTSPLPHSPSDHDRYR
jgi:hypothetical protein